MYEIELGNWLVPAENAIGKEAILYIHAVASLLCITSYDGFHRGSILFLLIN